jgi:hypothetical protein
MSRHGYYRVNPITTPATEAGWNRLKAAFAQLKKMGYSAGLTAASAKGRKDGNGVVYADSESARCADDSGVLNLNFGQGEAADGFDGKRIEAIGRIVVEVLTLHSVPWWWSGDAGMRIAVNVGMNAADYLAAEQVKAAKARCSEAQKVAREVNDKLAALAGNHCGYGPTHTEWTKEHDAAYYDAEAARYALETRAAEAACAAYQTVMAPVALEAPPVRAEPTVRTPVDETPCPACGCPLDMHRYEDSEPRDCAGCGCWWLLAHDGDAERVA